MSWLEDIYEEKNESIVVRKVRDQMDWLVFADERSVIRNVLETIDLDKAPTAALAAILKTLAPIRHRLQEQEYILLAMEEKLPKEITPEDTEESAESDEEE